MNALRQQNSAFQNDSLPTFNSGNVVPASITNRRVIVPYHGSSWMQELGGRFDQLTSLENGWDGYNGIPVSFTCASFAATLLEYICIPDVAPPSLVPGSDGTLQIEWHLNQYDLEIDVLDANNVEVSRYDILTGEELTDEFDNDFTILAEWVQDLARDRELPAQDAV